MTGETFDHVEFAFQRNRGNGQIDYAELSLTEEHDVDRLESLFLRARKMGWIPVGAKIYTDSNPFGEYFAVRKFDVMAAIFDALATDPEHAGTIIAYMELFGVDSDEPFRHCRYGREYLDNHVGTYSSIENFAREWVDDCDVEIPEWLSVDWEDTGNTLLNDFEYGYYGTELYVFLPH